MSTSTPTVPRPDEEAVMKARERIAAARQRQLDRRKKAEERLSREMVEANKGFVKAVLAERRRRVNMTDLAGAAGITREEIYRLIREFG